MAHPISVRVDPGLIVTVTVPDVSRPDLIEIIASFFASGPNHDRHYLPAEIAAMKSTFAKANSLRLLVTTDNPQP